MIVMQTYKVITTIVNLHSCSQLSSYIAWMMGRYSICSAKVMEHHHYTSCLELYVIFTIICEVT